MVRVIKGAPASRIVLAHRWPIGEELPIVHASQTFADAEWKYARLEKEGLVIFEQSERLSESVSSPPLPSVNDISADKMDMGDVRASMPLPPEEENKYLLTRSRRKRWARMVEKPLESG
eukprot:g34034.t1